MIYDSSNEMAKYHNEKVRLSEADKDKLRGYRDANLERLKNGLAKNGDPAYKKSISQGSYAMHTLNQHPDNDYDIDVGIIFDREDLKGSQGGDKASLAARQMVCDAMQDDRFNTLPEVLKNCVRVYYQDGHHVDMPVYRQYEDEYGDMVQELASSDWEESDPEAITEWFNDAVINQSPDTANGRQMRRITQLIKKWVRSRSSWSMPSGFIISVLVDEKYVAKAGCDDEALYETLKAIRNRLSWNKQVHNPVNGDLISDGKESQLQAMHDELDKALRETLNVLEYADCTHEQAMKAWSKFLNDDFFKDQISDSSENQKAYESIVVTTQPWRSN